MQRQLNGKRNFYFSSTNNAETTGYPHTKKMNLDPYTYHTQVVETEHKPKALLKTKR